MIDALTNNWWLFLLRGVASLAVAVLAFVSPGITLEAMVVVLGVYAFAGGALAFGAALSGVAGDRWWAALLEGLVGIAVALLIWFSPQGSTMTFVYVLAGWAILTGVFQIVAGIQLRDVIGSEWLYILSGIFSVAFGILVVRNPQQGMVAVAWLLGWYAVLFGLAQVFFSFQLRSLGGYKKADAV